MTPEEARFYAERDQRGQQYMAAAELPVGPVGLEVGLDAAETAAGQLAALLLVNMLARVHRTLRIVVPDVPLIMPSVLAIGSTLAAALNGMARAINPFIRIIDASGHNTMPSVGMGAQISAEVDAYLLIEGWRGGLSQTPTAVVDGDEALLGAGAAACIAAAFLFHRCRGRSPEPRVVSLWSFEAGLNAPGPRVSWPLDVGSVLVVGAGAVGSGLTYALSSVGAAGSWTLVDPDMARLHNTNRSLGMTAADVGWPEATVGAPKAVIAAHLLGDRASSCVGSYRDWLAVHPDDRPDLVLPLANADGVRPAVMSRGEPVLIHATTSPYWTAELHRHIPDVDDCIPCRLPETSEARLTCSEGPVDPEDATASADAALPFLSGAASWMLLAGLVQLALGELPKHAANHRRLHLDFGHRLITSSRWSCARGCRGVLPADVRRRVQRGARWEVVDILEHQ